MHLLTIRRIKYGVFSALLLTSHLSVAACATNYHYVNSVCQEIADTWNAGTDDLYLPFHAYHLRSAYTQKQIDGFREDSWGVGYGRSRYVNGNWSGVYGMGFLDSHSDIEPILGYAHQWMWGKPSALHAGLGYTAFVTARKDVGHYTPFPAVLPIASINYHTVSVNGTYVPGGSGYGNILFFWSRVGL